MIKCKPWSGKDLKGEWEVTYKLDGVRAISDGKNITSRNGKPLYNLDHLAYMFTDAEVCIGGSFKSTIEVVRAKNKAISIPWEAVYSLEPRDPRLLIGIVRDPSVELIEKLFNEAVKTGYEGIVLKQNSKWLKVKAHETFDVPCLEFIEGTGKFKGMLGKIVTPMGRVGTGFSDEERNWFWQEKPAGLILEVECNRLTEIGLFRHASFKQIRWDKS
jgi:ATP-dependent DNA ligase